MRALKGGGVGAPPGRVTLSDAIELITRHAERPDVNTAPVLSDQFR